MISDFRNGRGRILYHAFLKRVCGHRFDPELRKSYNFVSQAELCRRLGSHNDQAVFFQEADGERIIGVFLSCQCHSCLTQQTRFVIDSRVNMLGMGAGSFTLVRDENNRNGVHVIERSDSLFEEQVQAQRRAEREQLEGNLRAIVAGFQKLETRIQQLEAETRELRQGKLWSRQELSAMTESQNSENMSRASGLLRAARMRD
jgi:hypothetical protein